MKNKEEEILVIGNSRMDYLAQSGQEDDFSVVSQGNFYKTSGGLGRNVSENLARLHDNVSFITALGNDADGQEIESSLSGIGVKVYKIATSYPTSIYNSISDSHGKRQAALIDNRCLTQVKPSELKPLSLLLTTIKHVVIEASLNEKVIDYLFKNYPDHYFYCEGVSVSDVRKLRKHLKDIYLFKSNYDEAISILQAQMEPEEAVKQIMKEGCPNVVISHTELPIYYGNKGLVYREPILVRQNVTRTNGVGDALFAGIVHCLSKKVSLIKAVKFGLNMSYCTLGVDTAVDTDIARIL
ncbi:MAG: PfkB family carbohydrate kinase [Bacilli bacterium]